MLSSEPYPVLHSAGPVRRPRIERGIVLATAVRRSGLRWLTALLDSHPRSLCRNDPLERTHAINMKASLRKLQMTGMVSTGERERLIDGWTKEAPETPPALFFGKTFTDVAPARQWWSWYRARWGQKRRSEYAALCSPADGQPYNLLLTQTTSTSCLGPVTQGLNARLFVLRRHPGAVVASQLHGLRRGYLPPLDRVSWFEDNERACQELELRLSSVLRMPIAELLAYQWLVQNMQFRAALAQLPHTSLADRKSVV